MKQYTKPLMEVLNLTADEALAALINGDVSKIDTDASVDEENLNGYGN